MESFGSEFLTEVKTATALPLKSIGISAGILASTLIISVTGPHALKIIESVPISKINFIDALFICYNFSQNFFITTSRVSDV